MHALQLPLAIAALLLAPAQDETQAAPPAPATVQEIATVTATRLPAPGGDSVVAVEVIDEAALRTRPSQGIDEALRWVPQFSLFRRAPARASHPTTQGVNLRGIAPSGTSRALVLVDGVPVTDAFGGWVNWSRVPTLAVDHVEVVLGGASAAWGSQALGGVLQLVTRAAPGDGHEWRARLRGGTLATAEGGVAYGSRVGNFDVLAAAQAYRTGGYVAVDAAEAGPVDQEIAVTYASGLARLGHAGGARLLLEIAAEDRENGTPEQRNDTVGGGGSLRWSRGIGSGWQATLFGRRQVFRSRFSAVNDDRSAELATLQQRVPSTEAGGSLTAWKAATAAGLAAGIDLRFVDGASQETSLISGVQRQPGGRQLAGGVFAGGSTAPAPGLRLEAGVRLDGWRNVAHESADARRLGNLSPSLGIGWQAAPGLRLYAAAQQSFRAPTLNELYRGFRAGNVVTLANPDLGHERLRGVQGGLEASGGGRVAWQLRLSGHLDRLRDAVINASVDAAGTLRQRRNLGAASVDGLDADLRLRHGPWQLQAAAGWMRATIDAADDPALVGNRLPQVPATRWSAALEYSGSDRWHALVAAIGSGPQYEDDRNELRLAPGWTLDAGVRVALGAQMDAELQVQNLLDRPLQVARSPVTVLGPPRSVMLGLSLTPSRR